MSDHSIYLATLILTVPILVVAIWTLILTKKGVDHAETAAKAAQASLDDLKTEAAIRKLSQIEESVLRVMLESIGEDLLCLRNHFGEGLDLVVVKSGEMRLLKVPSNVLIRLEDLGHVASTGSKSWCTEWNPNIPATGFCLTPQGRNLAQGASRSVMVTSFRTHSVPETEARFPTQ